jgi:hypothetical protein
MVPSNCPEKNVCKKTILTTDLRLLLLSDTKLVISTAGHCSRHAQMGVPENVPVRAYQCLCRGVSRSRLLCSASGVDFGQKRFVRMMIVNKIQWRKSKLEQHFAADKCAAESGFSFHYFRAMFRATLTVTFGRRISIQSMK